MTNEETKDMCRETPGRDGLTPRQALGEAHACIERARDLLRQAVDGAAFSAAAHAGYMALASVNDAWAQVTSAQAHLKAETKE